MRERRQTGAAADQKRLRGAAARRREESLCAIVDGRGRDGPGGPAAAQVRRPAHAIAAGKVLEDLRRLAAR